MDNDTAALMVIIELRQRIAALEAEVARLRAEQDDQNTPE